MNNSSPSNCNIRLLQRLYWKLSKNRLPLKKFGVQKINLKVNAQNYPSIPYNADFDNGDFMNIHDDMLQSINFLEILMK